MLDDLICCKATGSNFSFFLRRSSLNSWLHDPKRHCNAHEGLALYSIRSFTSLEMTMGSCISWRSLLTHFTYSFRPSLKWNTSQPSLLCPTGSSLSLSLSLLSLLLPAFPLLSAAFALLLDAGLIALNLMVAVLFRKASSRNRDEMVSGSKVALHHDSKHSQTRTLESGSVSVYVCNIASVQESA